MAEIYTYYQPEYVSKFKCDGQKCSAKCCRFWTITIDQNTYEKYSNIKPESAAQEITCHISKFDGGGYKVDLDENFNCPFLTEDNWCKIQRKYGEDFLSKTCTTYPRRISGVRNFYEAALTLTCPVAAELVLLEKEPIKFEKIETSVPLGQNYHKISAKISPGMITFFVDIQNTAMTILQVRHLTIDQRLMMLGLYLDKLSELTKNRSIKDYELMQLNEIYRSQNFLKEQAAQFSRVLNFNGREHIRVIIGLLETLYGVGNTVVPDDVKIIRAITNTLKLKTDENDQVSISEVLTTYNALKAEREKFVFNFSTIFENYLINEFFMNLYPFKFENNLSLNYGVFVTIYKMLELVTFSMFMENHSEEKDLISNIMWYANTLDHNKTHADKIFEYMKDKSDILEIMQNMLQV